MTSKYQEINHIQKTESTIAVDCSNPSVSLQPYQEERLRQARLSFNTFLGLSVVTGFVSLLGIALLMVGKVQPGVITTTGGISSNIVSVRLLKLTKESNARLDETFNKSSGGN